MNRRSIALSLAVLAAMALVPGAQAQRQFAFSRPSGMRSGPASSRRGGMRPPFVRQRRARGFFPGYWPYFYPGYDYDYGYGSEPQIVETPPQQIIQQVAQPAAPAPVPPSPDSVVIELQGDHWVRVTNYGQSQTDGPPSEPERAANPQTAVPRRTQDPEPPTDIPAAVLVFRDGHREEIGKYVVVGSTLYASADYWSSGSWTRKVQLSALDVPATLKLNQERDAKFTLPSGPNEVMVRP